MKIKEEIKGFFEFLSLLLGGVLIAFVLIFVGAAGLKLLFIYLRWLFGL
ncbi:hypothetical protein [Lactobacillus crispatus]|nr:hypothetical protein [Lactobacillus crispatus]MCZ9601207.1 hypothetical protein [Lactobacillus crispatus]MCZ9617118.1 hypothetical protein [Lactobacillus crispatus]MDK6435564.1 hypothetical protein [Lactobacillus crispatus]MDK8114169.1 hypothetical protein [Lactobacillus crispatus]